MLFDGGFAARLRFNVNNFLAFAGEDFVQVIRCAMEFLGADDEIHVGQFIDQLSAPALGHATEETENDAGPIAADIGGDVLHFADGLLFRHVAHGAGVEQNDIRPRLGRGEGVAFGGQLSGDGLGVALVHLAAVGFDIDAWHEVITSMNLRRELSLGKQEFKIEL